jgi:DNA-binding transcriptional LysR family regulator
MVIFARVAEEQSFTNAAKSLGIPKSTVSRRVSHLEEQLGVRLLQRTTRKLRLTDVGAAYAHRCAAIRADIEEANLAVASAVDVPRGTLRVTAPVEIGRRYLAPLLSEYTERYPEVELEVYLADRLVDLVGDGYDLGIRVGDLQDSSLIARPLGPTQQLLCASPAYLEAHTTPRTPSDLKRHRIIVFAGQIGGSSWRLIGPEGEITVPVRPTMLANDFSVVMQLVTHGRGIARTPSWVASEAISRGELTRVLEPYAPPEVGMYAVYPTRRHLSAKVKTFLDLVVERFSPLPWVR